MPTVSVTNPGTLTNYDGNPIYDFISATDSDANALTYGASGLPAGLSVNTVTGSISGTVTPGDYTTSPYTVTITATDSVESESDTQTFTWNINEPTVSVNSPRNQTNYDGDSINLSITGTHEGGDVNYSATGLPPGLSMGYYTGIISGTIANAADIGSPYAVTVTATNTIDDVSASQSFNWVVNNPVSSTAPSNQTNYDGDAGISLQFSATDAEGNSLNYSASNLPSGLSIDYSAGTITGTIANNADQSSPNSVTVTATDSVNGASSSQTFTWTVNDPVSSTAPSDQTNFDGDSPTLQFSASDAESNSLSYSASNLPSGLSIDPAAGTITGTISPSADTSSPYSVTVTATDSVNGASSSQTFNWTVNPNPVSLTQPSDQSNYDGDTVSLGISASDADSNSLTYSASGLPSGLTIDSTTGLISGTIASTADFGSPYAVTVTATDSVNGAQSPQQFNWYVSPVSVSLTDPGDQSNYDGDAVTLNLSASENAGHSLTYSITSGALPPGLSLDPSSGAITGTISATADTSSPYSVTVDASDSITGTDDPQPFNWTVSPVSVALSNPGDQTNYDADTVSLQLSASDNASHTLSYSVTGGALPSGLSLSSSGLISGTISDTADQSGPYSVTITAADTPAEVSDTQTFNWTVTNPVSFTDPGDQTNFDGDAPSLQLSATDAAGNGLSYSVTSGALPPGLSLDGTSGLISGTIASTADTGSPYSVMVTATDTNGADASQTFSWTVFALPVATDQNLTMLHDTAYPDIDFATTTTGDTLTPIVVSAPGDGQAYQGQDGQLEYDPNPGFVGTDSFTVMAADGTADSNVVTITVTVTDTAPVATDATLSVEHDQVLTDIDLTQYVSDADGDTLTTTVVSQPTNGTLTQNDDGTYVYTPNSGFVGTDYISIQANDGAENSNVATITINVTQYAPVGGDGSYTVLHDRTLSNIDFSSNDPNADGNPAVISILSGPTHGTLTENSDDTYNYTPDAGYVGTDTVTITTGSDSVTVTINVVDHAPVALQTSVPIEAYNGVYQGMDFLADATDSDGDTLTVNIVTEPQYGTLVFNSTTGLYDYTANSGYLGQDSFAFNFYDGAEYSQTVTADILVDNATTNFATDSYLSGWIGLVDVGNTSFSGVPSPTSLRQGRLDDCWFVAAEDSLSNFWGTSIQAGNGYAGTPKIQYINPSALNPNWSVYEVTFAGRAPVTVVYEPREKFDDPVNAGEKMWLSRNRGNGDWAAILELGWAILNDPGVSSATAISDVLNKGEPASAGIEALTGHGYTYAATATFSEAQIATDLAYANLGQVVVAGETTPADALDPHGLVQATEDAPNVGHAYAVLSYNAATQMVQLQNPWGYNKVWKESVWVQPGANSALGGYYRQVTRPALGGGGATFSISLSNFCNWFQGVTYES